MQRVILFNGSALKKEMRKNKVFVACFCLLVYSQAFGRAIYRPVDPHVPEIITSWQGEASYYKLRNSHLDEYPLFTLFDKDFFQKFKLPDAPIRYRNNEQKIIAPTLLTNLINHLLQEISDGKRTFTHFIVLQSKDYNFKKSNGLIIVKFKDYPFVVKLFMETPESFVKPFDKGLEPIFSFFMAGGINRHLLGFTRIKNREIIIKKLAESRWKEMVDIPRKWHWIPPNSKWIQLQGNNIGSHKHQKIEFPGTYCIIADAIEAERMPSLFNGMDKKMALDLCNYLDIWIDPHMTNFMIEKETKKFIIVDTEHFPSFTGLYQKVTFSSYSSWYLYLAGKCWHNAFMQTKRERRASKKPVPAMSLTDYKFT